MEAKKEKKDDIQAFAKIWNFIKEDHKFENWLLFALALILLVLSLYILIAGVDTAKTAKDSAANVNTFADTYFNISNSGWKIFNKPWKVITTASCIVALSAGCIVYCLFPVYKPTFKELKFVTWTDKKTLFVNSLTVLLFIAFLTGLFYLFDFALVPLFKLLLGE